MSFGGGSPAPQPIPEDPANSVEARLQRENAERAALAEQRATGRRSTVAGGARKALTERQESGAIKLA